MHSATQVALSLLSLIPGFLLVLICWYYLITKSSVDSVLLAIGSAVGLLITSIHVIVYPYLLTKGIIHTSEYINWVTKSGFVGMIGSLCFATGLFMLVKKQIDNKIE